MNADHPDKGVTFASRNTTCAGVSEVQCLLGAEIDVRDLVKWRSSFRPAGADHKLDIIISSHGRTTDALDHVLLHLTTEPWDLEIDGHCVHVPAGALAVNSLTRPSRRSRCAEHDAVLLNLSRDLVAESLPDPEAFHGHIIPNALDTLFGAHLTMLGRRAPEVPLASSGGVARATAQLLAAALAPSRRTFGEAEGALRAARLTQCKRYIEHHLCSPELSADTICRNVGVSRSTLYRLFDADGGVAAYIRRRRLDAAKTALSASVVPRISDVARDFGFADVAAFSRTFKAAFGRSPRDIAHTRRPRTNVIGTDVFTEWIRAMRA